MTDSNIDFAKLMEPTARILLGEPNKALSKYPSDMRWGAHGSLSINFAKGVFRNYELGLSGGVVDFLKWLNGCDTAAAMGWLEENHLLNGRALQLPPVTPIANKSRKVLERYDYTDETGKVIFQVVRFEPKNFRQRRPDGNGGWIWNLEGTRRVLYCFPKLVAAIKKGTPVFLVEGEKDADNLAELGFTATTNPGGANKWRDEYAEAFRGASVIVIPDHDDAGREHVEKIIASLRGVAQRIRVLDLKAAWPECPEKGDISNWIEAGGNKQNLIELVKALPDLTAEPQPKPPPAAEAWPPAIGRDAHIGLVDEFVATVEPHTEADANGLLVQFLVNFGNIIGSSAYYQVESDRHHGNLFTLIVGASSKGRKGTGGNRVNAVTKLADAAWFESRTASGLSSGEGLIAYVRDPISKADKDGVLEVIDEGVTDKRLLVTEAEFSSPLTVMERAGNTLSPVLRAAWDGHKLQTMTRSSPLRATDPHISIIGHITQDELRKKLTQTEMANGFANRFLFVLVRRSKHLPFGGHLPEAAIMELAEKLNRAAGFAKGVRRVGMTDDASTEWAAGYAALSAERAGLFGVVTGRAEAQVIRLALLYALLDHKTEIGVVHLKAAKAVWAYCDASARLIFGDRTGNEIADTILEALRQSPDGMSRTDIYNLYKGRRQAAEIDHALSLLSKSERARATTSSTGGRPKAQWVAVGSG